MPARIEIASSARAFQETFGQPAHRKVHVPGRIELLGNHTDYNQGLVLAATVEEGLTLSITPRRDSAIRLRSGAFPSDSIDLPSPPAGSLPATHWGRYPIAILHELRRENIEVGGFDALVSSTLPPGGGLSSSAALLVATAVGLGGLPTGTHDERLRIARLCQRAEQSIGVNCGLLDYLTVLHGRRDQGVFIDLRSLKVRCIPWPDSLDLVLIDSGVRHCLSDGGYNRIQSACASAAAVLGIPSLREARLPQVEAGNLRHRLDPVARAAALHVITENQRVRDAVRALTENDGVTLGTLFSESHASSRFRLLNSCPELDEWVDRGPSLPGWLGGRLTGGGFGGMTIHLVRRRHIRRFLQAIPEKSAGRRVRIGPGLENLESGR